MEPSSTVSDVQLAADITLAVEDRDREELIRLGMERFPDLERALIEEWADMVMDMTSSKVSDFTADE